MQRSEEFSHDMSLFRPASHLVRPHLGHCKVCPVGLDLGHPALTGSPFCDEHHQSFSTVVGFSFEDTGVHPVSTVDSFNAALDCFSVSASSPVCALPREIQGLGEVIELLGFQARTSEIFSWCAESGAAFLEEIAEYAEDIADVLDLQEHERMRLLVWAADFNAASEHDVKPDPSEMIHGPGRGRVRWGSPLAEVVYFNIEEDDRESPLLEIVQSDDQYASKDLDCDIVHDVCAGKAPHSLVKETGSHDVVEESDEETEVDSDWDDISEVEQSDEDPELEHVCVLVTTTTPCDAHMHALISKVQTIHYHLCTVNQ